MDVNAAIWGVPSKDLSGSAESLYKNIDVLNGLDAWRRAIRFIDFGNAISLETLRRRLDVVHEAHRRARENWEKAWPS